MEIVDAIRRVVDGQHLERAEAESVMDGIMSGKATDAQIAAFLTALRMKCETVEELIGFARVIRAKASPVRPKSVVETAFSGTEREMLVDTCGTGGDAAGTFNISTATAFVVAGAGVQVAKHGNRSVSGICGSADVVEALGVRIDLPSEAVARCIDEVGIGFLYAPLLHSAMRYVMLARREMKIRTVFNLLGPLCNPAGANAQVLGVYSEKLTDMMAQVLCELGARRALVVHGLDGLDEITISGETKICEVRAGEVRNYYVVPEDFGLERAPIEQIQGGDARRNAEIIREVLSDHGGVKRDVVLLNAAAGLVAGGKARSLREGIEMARTSITSGAAISRLDKLVTLTQDMQRHSISDSRRQEKST
ncbi:MAG: anthranilate phosphoribosyltransferase [Acidobacteriia bacterium]|nr:anthranilate phosphoribosyltransferase [Terriglobia bacterium]